MHPLPITSIAAREHLRGRQIRTPIVRCQMPAWRSAGHGSSCGEAIEGVDPAGEPRAANACVRWWARPSLVPVRFVPTIMLSSGALRKEVNNRRSIAIS